MKKLIPFTLERWQQGNCTPKTEDAGEVKYLTYQPEHNYGFVLCGLQNGARRTWTEDGSFGSENTPTAKLMLEVDCEFVYVSLFRRISGEWIAEVRNVEKCFTTHANFIKEIKVEL
jgi:hypothetical protein